MGMVRIWLSRDLTWFRDAQRRGVAPMGDMGDPEVRKWMRQKSWSHG